MAAQPQPDHYLPDEPSLKLLKSTVVPGDLVLHTLQLGHQGWTWYVTFQWSQIKDLQSALQFHRLSQFASSLLPGGGSGGGGGDGQERRKSEPAHMHAQPHIHTQRHSMSRQGTSVSASESNTSRASNSVRVKRRSSSVSLPQMFYQDTATRSDSVSLSQQRVMYEQYLGGVLAHKANRHCAKLLELLQVSLTTFDKRQGPSFREGWVSVTWAAVETDDAAHDISLDDTVGASVGESAKDLLMRAVRSNGGKRWCVLKPSFLAFYKTRHDAKPDAVLLLDTGTRIQASLFQTIKLVVSNASWRFEIKPDSQLEHRQWSAAIQGAIARAPWVERDRFSYGRSLATSALEGATPTTAQWLVDGDAVYQAYHAAIQAATSEILISGLWVSPDVHLLRPPHKHPGSRLDKLLEDKAYDGVQIYILMFREAPGTLTINSKYSKKRFQSLRHHGNVHILRSGDDRFPHAFVNNESLLIIDQSLAFVGSVRLALGQYDTATHCLVDQSASSRPVWPGRDYSNPLVKDITGVELQATEADLICRSNTPRMPVHTAAVVVSDTAAADVSWHFISRWNIARHRYNREAHVPALRPLHLHTLDLGPPTQMHTHSHTHTQARRFMNDGVSGFASPATDESGGVGVAQSHVDPSEYASARRMTRRLLFGASSSASVPPETMPYATATSEQKLHQAASDKLKEAMTTKRERARQRLLELQHDMDEDSHADVMYQSLIEEPIMPATEALTQSTMSHTRTHTHSHTTTEARTLSPNKASHVDSTSGWDENASYVSGREELKDSDGPNDGDNTHAAHDVMAEIERSSMGPMAQCTCRVVRSIGLWTGVRRESQTSISEAYEHIIASAQHFVYMETPTFISGVKGDTCVQNRVADALVNRIVRAQAEGKRFRVILLLPLLPVYSGALQGSAPSALTGTLYHQLRSISALRERLTTLVHHPDEYLQIFSLRSCAWMPSPSHTDPDTHWVTEQVLVSSNILIADDRVCVLGSASVNDRSLCGARDTEMAVVLEDCTHTRVSMMDGRAFSAGTHTHSLRLRLWAEHLGVSPSDDDIVDPVASKTWDFLRRTAEVNSAIFGHVFPEALPSNSVRTLAGLKDVKARQAHAHTHTDVLAVLGDEACDTNMTDEMKGAWLRRLQGRLVRYPYKFMSQDLCHLRPIPALEQWTL